LLTVAAIKATTGWQRLFLPTFNKVNPSLSVAVGGRFAERKGNSRNTGERPAVSFAPLESFSTTVKQPGRLAAAQDISQSIVVHSSLHFFTK
jgi:hypothetical protein